MAIKAPLNRFGLFIASSIAWLHLRCAFIWKQLGAITCVRCRFGVRRDHQRAVPIDHAIKVKASEVLLRVKVTASAAADKIYTIGWWAGGSRDFTFALNNMPCNIIQYLFIEAEGRRVVFCSELVVCPQTLDGKVFVVAVVDRVFASLDAIVGFLKYYLELLSLK